MKILLLSLLLFCHTAIADIELTPENAVLLAGPITPIVLATTVWALEKKPEAAQKYLILYTPGGYLEGCEVFASNISKIKNLSIIIVRAYSAGAFISQMFPGDRIVVPNGVLMFHQVRMFFQGWVTVQELRKIVEEESQSSSKFDAQCKSRMRITQEEYDRRVTGNDWFVSAEDAVILGAAERVEKVTCSKTFDALKLQVEDPDDRGKGPKKSFCKVLTDLQEKGSKNGKAPIGK